MRSPAQTRKGMEQIVRALAIFVYLTAEQLTRLLYSKGSLTYVKATLKSLVDLGFAVTVGGRVVPLPLIYRLTGEGRSFASIVLESPTVKRFRPSEEREKAGNLSFIRHTLAVNDVLIAARLLSQTAPDITLTRMFQEQELKRTIYVELPERTMHNRRDQRTTCIEPDASLEFTIQETWQGFFHIEVYCNLPPLQWRYKQKVRGYVTYADTGQHEALFHTPALSIAVFAATDQMAATLKQWTEEALQEVERQQDGEWFFFCSLAVATVSPIELFLSPVWKQTFRDTKIPLLVLE
jgi:hypothetical protein